MRNRRYSNLTAIVIAILVLFSMVGPAEAAVIPPAGQTETADKAQLLQFTSGGTILGFSTEGVYTAAGSHALHESFVGAKKVEPKSDIPAGNNGKLAELSRVNYKGLWQGITLTYNDIPGSIYKTTYKIDAGANPEDIRLKYNAPVTLNGNGTLSIAFATGTMTESAPVAWQEINNRLVPVDVSFEIRDGTVSYHPGQYDPRYGLTIDPYFTWNTFLGGSGNDFSDWIAIDGSGNIYVMGMSNAAWGSPLRSYTSGSDTFVSKLDSSGNLQWTTFLGGSGDDYSSGIAVDSSGNVYAAGYSDAAWSCSPTSCTVRAYNGSPNGFVAKLNSSGSLLWNTFLGGSYQDAIEGITIDSAGYVYITGTSNRDWSCIPAACTLQAYTSGSDAFAAKVNSSGYLVWNTFMGGDGNDVGTGISVDASGNIYVIGRTDTTWGNPVRGYSGDMDAMVVKLKSSGILEWNTFLGESGTTLGNAIAVDDSGNIYAVGRSNDSWGCSPTPCTVRGYTSGSGGTSTNNDGFAAKLDTSGNLLWNTFLGGSDSDSIHGVALDSDGNPFVVGLSSTTWGSPLVAYGGGVADSLIAKLDPYGNLLWNAFQGESAVKYASSLVLDDSGNLYLAGNTDNTWGSPVRAYNSGWDGFVAKLSDLSPSILLISGNAGAAGVTLSYTDGTPKTAVSNGGGNYSLIVPIGWTGTITPSKTGYTFSPESRDYTSISTNQSGQNYTATPILYTISGNAGAAGATLTYTDGSVKTATAAGDGSYSFTVSYNWSGTVTPSKSGYTFSPPNTTYTNVLADQPDQNYTATPITYTISGNAGTAGATLTYTDGSVKTATAASDGSYSFTVSYNWSSTVTPSKNGYTFSPPNTTYTTVLADQPDQNYTATAGTYTISGNAGIAEAILTYTDGSTKTANAASDGSYSFIVSYNWSGIVTPSLTCYTFDPVNQSYFNVISNQLNQNYTPSLIPGCIPGPGTYDDMDANWVYSGSWATRTAAGPYNNTYHSTNANGAKASFKFSGNGFKFTYAAGRNLGLIQVDVDGNLITTINSRSNMTTWNKTYTSPIFHMGTHTVTFTKTGGPNTLIDIDAITINVPDLTAPGAITDLSSSTGPISGTVKLAWTAPPNDTGNMASGPVSAYQVRYSNSPIFDATTWDAATPVITGLPVPLSPGSTQAMTLYGLTPGSTYYFAVRAQDLTPNLADLSNSPSAIANPALPPDVGTYDDTDVNWIYSSGWLSQVVAGAYHNTIHYTRTGGAKADFKIFQWWWIKLLYTATRNRGRIEVKVDGIVITTINAWSGTLVWQKTYTSPVLSAGPHTVTITNINRGGVYIDVDAITILP